MRRYNNDKKRKELVRVSVVDASRREACERNAADQTHSDVVLDSLVKPALPIVDMVTRVHGIKEADLDGVAFTPAHARAALEALCCDRTVLIGHAIANDLEALCFHHTCVVDTACTFGVEGDPVVRQEIAALTSLERASQWTADRATAARALGRALAP